jgi:putative membrane protein
VRILLHWLITAAALLVAIEVVPGISVTGRGLLAVGITAAVLGLMNAFVRPFLRVLGCGFIILTLGLFLLVINGMMILLASSIVRGFYVRGFVPAFWGAVVLALLGMVIRGVTKNG